MSKRANGEGSIYRYRNGWRGQITIDGKRRSFTGNTKVEVANKIAEALVDSSRGDFIESNDVTVREWVESRLKRQLELHTKGLQEQSYTRLLALFENHVFSRIGDVKLQDLDKPMLEQMYAESFQSKTGKEYQEEEYSHSTVNQLSVKFKAILKEAVDEGILQKNPHDKVELHKLRPPKKVEAHTRQEQEKIVEFLKASDKMYDRVFYLCIATGMRFGEAAALTWDCVDLKNKTITINKTSVEVHGSPTIQEHTKTNAGMRTISIGDPLVKWLKEIKKTLSSENNYRNLVVPNSRYEIVTSANSSRRWEKICAILDIRYMGKHALRHTWATRALEEGIPVKTVSQMLGHKNVITTMNIYQDALKEHQEEQIKKLDNLF